MTLLCLIVTPAVQADIYRDRNGVMNALSSDTLGRIIRLDQSVRSGGTT